ncbi:hypothetical protein KCMC57_up19400 [Kitasatospora sp. CMC57]|uniref:ABC transporter permease n=1 Tax=Kitasatospora sp. CMC57 TaxID=3231513 RepID=A0AB33JW87_9ACTN
MNWLTLYARSRQVPVSAALVALVALTVWFLNEGSAAGPSAGPVAVLVLTGNVAAATVGLAGQDVALDRTAAIRWAFRRALHVLLIGAFAGGALLAVQAAGPELLPTALVVRDSAGLAGLAALGVALGGTTYAWILPTGWLALTFFVPPLPGLAGEIGGWMVLSPATTVSGAIPWAMLATGTLLYAVLGPKR